MSTPMRARRVISILLAASFLAMPPACTAVRPWQRELHADPAMTFGADAEENAGTDHALSYREGTPARAASGGGGCGCN
jgi:hypothetical protein